MEVYQKKPGTSVDVIERNFCMYILHMLKLGSF